MVGISAMNLQMHGIYNLKLKYMDTLSNDNTVKDKFSLVLANPPFTGSELPAREFGEHHMLTKKDYAHRDINTILIQTEKGLDKNTEFMEYFSQNRLKYKARKHSMTINYTNKETVSRELTKYYIRNPKINGVFVTNSQAHLVSEFHLNHDLDIRVVGFYLAEENIDHLNGGGVDCVISQSPMQQSTIGVQTLFELFIYNNEPKKIQHIPLGIIIKENLDFYINFH